MEKLIVIKTLDELSQLFDYVQDKTYIAFDTETTGVDKEARVIGFSICAEEDVGYYVILSYWDVQKKELIDLETKSRVAEFLKVLLNKQLITQNGIFDAYMTYNNFGIQLVNSIHTDTLILGHLLNENRSNGLKELGVELFGEDARKEQLEMKDSVHRNGGSLTKKLYELYKADADLIAKYGAKDAILTLKVFTALLPLLFEQGLEGFYYDDESLPLFKGPTYDMNTTGLKVDIKKLQRLKQSLEAECMELKAFIYQEITPKIQHKYKGTKPSNTFNIGASKQLSWLIFEVLGNEFGTLTDGGREVCEALGLWIPYGAKDKRLFIKTCKENEGKVYEPAKLNPKTGKMTRPKKVGPYWNYTACGKESLARLKDKYKWVDKLLLYAKNLKLLNTYVIGIQTRMQYGIIRPSFLQHGTTGGRYSSKNPNFQNLPRDDKRIKACIVARSGKVFVGADYSQLEPRVFASFSGDKRLLDCFRNGDDFYSVIGAEVFSKHDCSLKKNDSNSFAKLYPKLRDSSKVVALSATYGTTAHKMASGLGKTVAEAQEIIDDYFEQFPRVKNLMLESHEMAKRSGQVVNLFGRPRRMPDALKISKRYGKTPHAELPYEIRNILNLAVNHRIQSTAASIMNRAAIAFKRMCNKAAELDERWNEVKLVMQIHDEIIAEGPEALGERIVALMKEAMEHTVELPGVELIAEPKIARNLADLK